ncbi:MULTISPECIES: M20 family metallopeptidase [unclassified Clostridium]|uniref:M20 family metallopeptidase n=1 Tax=unclassified Clostridium TaxID=2614128 RepID=UPI00189A4799|nr:MULTISPECIES: M20 family metallopeptidase [unclassified Clostridium]MBP3915350.1 M20 family metallopeptidase [Clostridium sp.]MEE0932806.1 M20 family metallopeptidase [Clostridium sp.]
MKARIYNEGQLIKERLAEISDYIYNNPELGNEEYKAVEALTTFLKDHDFKIEAPIADMATAFKATFDSGKPGMTIGYLCEYDALPKIGHGCGHNMIGVMSAGAGVVLSKVLHEIGGKVIVYGTPAEETNGGKVILAEAGVFDELDAAMIVHPDGETRASGSSSALYPIRFIYKGKTAHAASCPEKGINALNSVIQLFNGIDALRQHVTPDVRMHGIITKGGVAANIVPDEAIADFYFRASTKERVTEVVEKVKKIAEGAALMTGATLEMERYELPYDDLNTNETLSEMFNSNLRELGITDIKEAKSTGGSSDIGNVSYVAPTIHPYIGITDCPMVGHSVEMANATTTSKAHDRLLIAALAMAYTGHDVIVRNESLRK